MNAHVVVAGAGYAGVVAAKRLLSRKPSLRVTVVNPRPEFVERIRLHQLAAGNHPATQPLSATLHPQAQLVIGVVASIDALGRAVRVADGDAISYDYLIYAVGSNTRLDHIAGAGEHAFTVGEYGSAQALRLRVADLAVGTAIVVVGGGLTGIETAAELAEQLPELSLTLVSSGRIADGLHDKARTRILRALAAHSVDVVEGGRVIRVDRRTVELADGRILDSACTIVATESTAPALARRSGLPTDENGRLLVDVTLTCPDWPSIVGAGDAIAIDGKPLRMSCQAAIPLGVHAADTLLRRIEGTAPTPVDPTFVARCVSLGRRAGVIQRTDASDNPRNTVISGRMGALIKEQVCASTLNWGVNPRRPVLSTWS
ncbi:oxidoreductase [Rhodococcus sp. ABRD24]|uniref:NAD(P)/FAD-dependent oxidoreductase n=1 Tax=Rhodococcus sp. ABRD24 TaxID=2507582 RepID=UPI00103E5BE6|nr:FAD-dependent oxidoreductase [Rhodococcus sp. ABRD24]QBJ98376.1 oxidoreductase [Rhodococcus sp. ABRD24]